MNLNSAETGLHFCEGELDKSNGFLRRSNVYFILGIVKEQSFVMGEMFLIPTTLCEQKQATGFINVLSQQGNYIMQLLIIYLTFNCV
jgi:hypothetical protein